MILQITSILLFVPGIIFLRLGYLKSYKWKLLSVLFIVFSVALVLNNQNDNPVKHTNYGILWLINMIVLILASLFLIIAILSFPTVPPFPSKFGATITFSISGLIPITILLVENQNERELINAGLLFVYLSTVLIIAIRKMRKAKIKQSLN
jgi:lysylphosphatidylglycerol synthetase-like protein (DUF2156 family)